jgi:hypothetical protein
METVRRRQRLGVVAQVVLPELAGIVAEVAQEPRERGRAGPQVGPKMSAVSSCSDHMIPKGLTNILKRVESWPKTAQEEAIKALREIEEDYIIGPATRHELDRSHQEALRGEGMDMEELFGRH